MNHFLQIMKRAKTDDIEEPVAVIEIRAAAGGRA